MLFARKIKPTRTHNEICMDVANHYHTPKELRKIHKELKYYGDGIFFSERYPYSPAFLAPMIIIIEIIILSLL